MQRSVFLELGKYCVKMVRRKILFIKPWNASSFIEQDERILRKHFATSEVTFSIRKLPSILRIILSKRVDGVYLWFVFWWAALIVLASKLTRVKTILIPSGVDIANYPEIKYGNMRFLRHRIMARFALNHSDMVLPVSFFIKDEVLKYASPRNMKVIYNGINVEKFRSNLGPPKEDLVITVGAVNEMNMKYKGFDLFLESAKHMPSVKFALIGSHLNGTIQYLRSKASSNVMFLGFLPFEKLLEYYRRAKVYAQLSHAEAFGCALAEAMACECIPVVVKRGALPEVVGDTGLFAPYDDPKMTAKTIRMALDSKNGSKARERVLRLFSLSRREHELVRTLNKMFSEVTCNK